MDNIIVVHGSFGSAEGNWFPWLIKALPGRAVIVPQFAVGVGIQTYESWERLLDYYNGLGLITKDTTLIGHSIGAVFICKYILKHKIKVDKCIFVAGFNQVKMNDKDYDAVNESFFIDYKELPKIKNFANKIVCIYGDNDQYIPQNELKKFAGTVAQEVLIIKDGGHLNAESGYYALPQLLRYL